jgi:hypothetical protein
MNNSNRKEKSAKLVLTITLRETVLDDGNGYFFSRFPSQLEQIGDLLAGFAARAALLIRTAHR